ncbi:MAG: hypothetical protein HYW45_02985 [Candidatus Daviesbacteria bacterium]|nr:MAG: hypothetical protein HYW45_02985 [Candidatus Daviesbacteria bacterium]
MKALILILLISTFLQTTIWPLEFALIIILIRAAIKPGPENLYLSFGFGVLLAHLLLLPLGSLSLLYLVLVMSISLILKRWHSEHPLILILLVLSGLLINDLAFSVIIKSWNVSFAKLAVEAFLILPIYIMVKFLEERFIVKSEIKLKF